MSHDPLDRYLDAFGTRLEAAAAAPPPRPRRAGLRRAALIAGPIAALALTAVLLLLPGSTTPRRLDVVAEARAALSARQGVITHLVVRQHLTGGDARDRSSVPAFTTEQWSATRPVRWRLAYEMPHNSTNHPGQPVEIAYAAGVEQEYYPKINHVRRSRGIGAHGAPAASPLGTDPVATLRGLLARGVLRDAGTARIGDREVRHLVGTRTRTFPTKNGDRTFSSAVAYDVDPTTFAPVRARIGMPLGPQGAASLSVILDFATFERLPLTAETAKLLEVHPKPGVSITEIGRRR